jgi:serine/threonine-protein kinase
MNITDPFVLKSDILLIPCADLSEDVRAKISFEEGDFTLSHRHGRSLAQVIDGETAALLALFREPRTIVEAVIENSRALGKDPRTWLDELLPLFGTFVHKRVLVPAGAEEEKEVRPQFDGGANIGDWTIVRCASLVEDSEVYQLRDGSTVAALKIARIATPPLRTIFDNEIVILRHLDGIGIAPRLLEAGAHEERPYLIVEWIGGVDAAVAAAQRRHDRAALVELCASIAAAYAKLHERGVLHADIHPRNIVVGEQVTLLDFGYSRFADATPRVGRGGLYTFFEPEHFASPEQGAGSHSSPAGEQYSLAALLYLLIAGKEYLDFRFDRQEMVRQIREDAPLPFSQRGVPPWPEVERILFRALEKDPARRYVSIAQMAGALASARDVAAREALTAPLSAETHALLETTLQSFARGGAMFATRYPVPSAGINHGAAGAAMGLLRIAEARGDAALLALADVWRSRAAALIDSDHAYYDDQGGLPRSVLGDVTPYHTESGIHATGAMIAAAMGDTVSQRRAIQEFLRSSRRPCAQLDLTLGRSGSLLAAAMLLPICDELPEDAALRAFGTETMHAIWSELDARPAIDASPKGTYLGMAHGWAGYIYAALRWCAVSGDALPARLVERLDEYTTFKALKGRGAYWRKVVETDSMVPGWCNGSAGQVFLFVLAHRVLGDARWLQLAEACAWTTWDEPRPLISLCCGTAGRGYALLNLYKHTGATEWLSRARHLANDAATAAPANKDRPHTLWKGDLGAAVLIADLASPENARMPFFE